MGSNKKKSLFSNETGFYNPIQSATLNLGNSQVNQEQMTERSRIIARQIYLMKGFLGCIGGLMIHLVIGSLYQWGLLNPYMTSYFRLNGDYDLTTKDMVFIFPLMMFSIGVTMVVGLKYGDKFRHSNVAVLAFTLASICVFVSSFFANLVGFALFYVVGFGMCVGVNFLIPMKVCNDYFPNKQIYINGFILIGSGLGSVVFGLFAINVLNPEHLPPIDGMYIDQSLDHIPEKIPVCVRWLSLFYFVVGVAGSLLLRPLQKFNKFQVQMQKTLISKTIAKKNKNEAGHCLNAQQAITSQIFWVHVLIIVLSSCGNILINTNYRIYANQKEYDTQYLNLVGFIGSSTNGFSRYFWSALFNRVGYKITMSIILSINIVCLFTVHLAVQIQALYLVEMMIFNATLGGLMVLAPTFSSLIFGKQVGPRVFGIFWCSFAIGNFLQYSYTMLLDQYIRIDGIIYICIGMNLLNLIIIVTYKFLGPWKNDLKYFKFKVLPQFQLIQDTNQLLVYSVISNRRNSKLVSSQAYDPQQIRFSS